MKKINWLIFTFLLILLPTKVGASSFNTSLGANKTINANSQFTVTVSASNANNLIGIVGKLSYDSSKVTLVSNSGLNGYSITIGSNLVADNTVGKTGTFSFVNLTFQATGNFIAGQSTSINFTNITGSDGVTDVSGISSSVSVYVQIPKSTNNNLSSLTVNNAVVSGFNAYTTSYSMTVNNNVSTISIGASVADSKSSLSGTGSKNLNVYGNTFYIVVTAENGSKKTYTLNVTRKDTSGLSAPLSTNNLLGSLSIEGYDIGFNANVSDYALTVENNISSLILSATAQDAKSKVEIGDTSNLKIGDNTINIIVTAENGSKKTYTVVIKRKNEGPTTTIGELLNIIPNTTSNQINIDIKDDVTTLTTSMIEAIKKSDKNITINFYQNDLIIYKWEIKGGNIINSKDLNTKILFTTDNQSKIASLTNYADNLYLNFAYSGDLPNDTYISVNVSSKYENGSKVNLYYYNEKSGKIEKIYENLIVEEGYVKFKLEHCSEYILSMSEYAKPVNNNILIYQITLGILALIVTAFISKFIYDFNINKKEKSLITKETPVIPIINQSETINKNDNII